MKRQYAKPVVKKITFDFRAQILTASPTQCFESVMNVKTADNVCGEGMLIDLGWNKEPTIFGP